LLVAISATLVIVPASAASSTVEGKVCANTGTGFCLTPSTAGRAGEEVGTVPSSAAAKWHETEVAKVTAESPFSHAKWDQKFLGDPVLQFAAVPDPGYCATDEKSGNPELRYVVSEPCGAKHTQYYVEDAHRLINVAATDAVATVIELTNDQAFVNEGVAADAAPGSPFSYGEQHWCLDQSGTDCVGP
jgi:hypothetical protein